MENYVELYFVVNLCGDIEKKYKIVCKMDFFNTVMDLRTGRKIFIKDMYSNDNLGNLYCHNKFKAVSRDEAYKIIKNDDIDEYNNYLDEIEKRNSNAKKRVKRRK